MTITVVLVDDQALVRGAMAALLDLEADLRVVGEAGTGDEALDLVLRVRPDVVLMDVDMPGMDGIETARLLRERGSAARVLIVTTFGRPGYLRRGLQAGAAGFVVKDTPARLLADAVRRVHAGMRVVDPTLATDSLIAGESPLTPGKRTCCGLLETAAPSPTSPPPSSSAREPSATTSPARSARPTPATAPTPAASPTTTAGCEPLAEVPSSLR